MSETHPVEDQSAVEVRAKMARALAAGGFNGVNVTSRDTADRVLTDRRLELLETIKHEQPESVRDLARMVDRDKGAVSRDLATLCEAAVVTYEENGRAKRPVLAQEHLVVEPIV